LVLILILILRIYFERNFLIRYKKRIIIYKLIREIRKVFTINKNIEFKENSFGVIIIRLKVLIFKVFFLFNLKFNSNYII